MARTAGRGPEAREESSRGRPFRIHVFEGFEILVGRGDRENEVLTFRTAEPGDFWLHVAAVPGSHVIVRNPESCDELPHRVAQRAASLAALHSRAGKSKGKVEVHLCRVKDVHKQRGTPPGEVLLRRWTSLFAYPRAASPEEA